uniref:LOW QUALITY PROTEIN: uncharacterized protein LOC778872 n=1 Tax=Ciona intestinalis TaxID=7719 RepID=UPI000EF4ED28|nr:LOW QUALITY PROTEIN: uncharacterized protein LOC778872 [Ciona intestinalis]|eukprot:XP_018666790.2 LOW QUALITY PROTEIN: uncharacterized protein LOC778872 [Ciona intestinalis]
MPLMQSCLCYVVYICHVGMPSCSVPFCVKYGELKKDTATLHRFPQDKEFAKLWLKNINNPTLTVNSWNRVKTLYICSKHFTPKDFMKVKADLSGDANKKEKIVLKPDAVPTIFEYPPKRYEMRTRNKNPEQKIEQEEQTSDKKEKENSKSLRSKAASKVVQIQPKLNVGTSSPNGTVQLKPKSDHFTIIPRNLQTSNIQNKFSNLKSLQVNLKNNKMIGQVSGPVLVKLLNNNTPTGIKDSKYIPVIQQSSTSTTSSKNSIPIQLSNPIQVTRQNAISIKPSSANSMMKMHSPSQVVINSGPVVFSKELHAAPKSIKPSSTPVYISAAQKRSPDTCSNVVTSNSLNNCSIQIVPIKPVTVTHAPSKTTPSITSSHRPANSVSFGRAPRVVAKKFHDSYGKHGSLTVCIRAALSVAPKLQRKYKFIKMNPASVECILVGVPSERDSKSELQKELANLDKYVRENHLKSRASAIEELLFSDPTPIPNAVTLPPKKENETVEKSPKKDKPGLKNSAMLSKKNATSDKELDNKDDTDGQKSVTGHVCKTCKCRLNSKSSFNRHCQSVQHRMMLAAQRALQGKAPSLVQHAKNKAIGSKQSKASTSNLFKAASDSSALIYRSFKSVKGGDGVKVYKCFFCLQCISGSVPFLHHIWQHCITHKRCCSWCGTKFRSAAAMKTHILTIVCSKEKVELIRNKRHLRLVPKKTHENTSTSSWISRRYTGVIPDYYKPFETKVQGGKSKWFSCNFCTFIGLELSSIVHHARQHIGDYPFRCSECVFGSVCKTRLVNHQSMSGHHGFYYVRRSTGISEEEIKELEKMIASGLLKFNAKGWVDSMVRDKPTDIPASMYKIDPYLSETKQKKLSPLKVPSDPKPSKNKTIELERTEEDPWMFCKSCNTGFLDRETYEMHSQGCNGNDINTGDCSWTTNTEEKQDCVLIDNEEEMDSPEVSPGPLSDDEEEIKGFNEVPSIQETLSQLSSSASKSNFNKLSNKKTLDSLFHLTPSSSSPISSSSNIEKTVQSLTLKNQHKLLVISSETKPSSSVAPAVVSGVEPCSVGRRSRQKQKPQKLLRPVERSVDIPSTSKAIIDQSMYCPEPMDTSM